ncbi:MAG: aminodeoxychorismate synthase component I [Gammaproteobacteria bacterium]|nr:aminodeoxychorismate synthase component I [Gammaproteobacteria bacterium]
MTQACQYTEISIQALPELIQFYRHFPDKYPFVLNTSSKSSQTLNFDIVFIKPDYYLTMDASFQLSCSDKNIDISQNSSFLDTFDQLFLSEQNKMIDEDSESCQLPFRGGWFVFFAYEFAQQLEPTLQIAFTLSEQKQYASLPIAYAARVKQALIVDHQQKKAFFLSEQNSDHESAYQALLKDIQQIQQATAQSETMIDWQLTLEEEKEECFLHSADKVHDYIKEGDVFQVNLSRLWKSVAPAKTQSEQAFLLAQSLNQKNPAPFSGLASFVTETAHSTIISSSPERLLKVNKGVLESRPIAGTRPRSPSNREDLRLLDELHHHPKEQAEHIMLIDLIRNDLGRVCIPGSVKVDELMSNETYAYVHHIVSNVIGKLRIESTPGDVIKALFPGGTITGCPKIRCMEIIEELEQSSRGAYTGSMGYINRDGSMDLNILIRTLLLERNKNEQILSFRAGAGLVFDSIAQKELEETRAKAKGLLYALQINHSSVKDS